MSGGGSSSQQSQSNSFNFDPITGEPLTQQAQMSVLNQAPSETVDNSARIAEEQAQKRQAQITQGQGSIDSAFGKFNDDYFGGYQKAYVDNYNPQLDSQFTKAQEKLRYDQARKGVLNSTPAITAFDKLNENYGQQRQKIAGDAINAVDGLKNTVQTQKSNLYSLNTSAADPGLAAERAASAVGTIPTAPTYSVLGDLFGGLVNGGAAYVAGQSKALPPGYGQVFNAGSGLPGGKGSGRVVS